MWAPRFDAHDNADWSAGRDDSTMPWFAEFDYIEYSKWVPETDSFEYVWRDEFDGDHLDFNKWMIYDKTGGFTENLSTYRNTQIYTENGTCKIKLDHNP